MRVWTLSSFLRAQLLAFALWSLAQASVPNPTLSESQLSDLPSDVATPSTLSTITGQPPASTTPASSPSSSTTGAIPSPSDDAPNGQNNPGNTNSGGIVNYYFVFFALIIGAAGLGLFFAWRRKRMNLNRGRQPGLARDLTSADQQRRATRRYLTRWRSADASREEGLNEAGEAPPPYLPKTPEEERREREGGEVEANGVAVPLQTLSRESAGLKPPDYAEVNVRPLSEAARRSSATGEGSSHDHDGEHDEHGDGANGEDHPR